MGADRIRDRLDSCVRIREYLSPRMQRLDGKIAPRNRISAITRVVRGAGRSCEFAKGAQSSLSRHSREPQHMTVTDTTSAGARRHLLLGTSPGIAQLRLEITSAAQSEAKVLLTGETGVGKEVVAHSIHQESRRSGAPFVTINCAGVPDSLLESELFGHARGSFTGAFRDNPGLLRNAHGGTVFLDEVGEMSLRMQALLLRFLETGELQTVGAGTARTHVDVRVITATNRNLLESVSAREFRADLFYRLNVFHLHIPPLRERGGDIPLLLEHYGHLFGQQHGRTAPVLSDATLDVLTRYSWPGNIRELRNLTERVVSRAVTQVIEPADLPNEVRIAVNAAATQTPAGEVRPGGTHRARVEAALERLLVNKESFWTAAYAAFMSRDIVRDDMRHIIHAGLEQTHGSYRVLLSLFNMPASDYKRFLGFLKQHDCHLPFQRFRAIRASRAASPAPSPGRLSA
jgi:transcriptional regulator with GAF, ATPase, and Fis domain